MQREKSRSRFLLPLTAAMCLSLLFGCTGTSEPPKQTADHNKKEAESSEPDKKADPNEYFTLKALSNTPGEVPDLQNQFWTKVQHMFKVKLSMEFVPADDYESRLRQVLATGDLPEAMVLNSMNDSVFHKAVKQGLFWDLNELAGDFSEFPNLKTYIPEAAWKYTKINGKNYMVPRARPLLDGGLHWRPDLFRKQGLPQPKTLDEYIHGLKLIVDANPNRPYIGLHFEESLFNAFGGFETVYNHEGGLIHKYFTDNYTEFVKWYRKVYSIGLMSKNFSTLMGSDKENMFRSDKALTYFRNMYHSYTFEQELKKVGPSYEAGVMTYLNGPKGHTGEYGTGFFGGYVISKKVPKDKALRILHVYNQASDPEVTDQLLRGFEGIHYKVVNGERVPTELAKKEISNAVMQVFPNAHDEWQKVINNSAPKEWNDMMMKTARTLFEAKEAIDPFRVISSETWLNVWPKVQDDYNTIRTKAIMGLISMNEYENFVKEHRDKPELKKAYKEFAESYKQMFN